MKVTDEMLARGQAVWNGGLIEADETLADFVRRVLEAALSAAPHVEAGEDAQCIERWITRRGAEAAQEGRPFVLHGSAEGRKPRLRCVLTLFPVAARVPDRSPDPDVESEVSAFRWWLNHGSGISKRGDGKWLVEVDVDKGLWSEATTLSEAVAVLRDRPYKRVTGRERSEG